MTRHLIRRGRRVGRRTRRSSIAGTWVLGLTVLSPPANARPAQAPGTAPPGPPDAPVVRIRPLDETAEAILADARRLSPSVVCLIEQLEQTDVIVYLQGADGLPWPTGELRLVTATPAGRVLLVRLERARRRTEQIGSLAHELQHVKEIAGDPNVVDAKTLESLYRRIGLRTALPNHYETGAAIAVEKEVAREVYESRRAAG